MSDAAFQSGVRPLRERDVVLPGEDLHCLGGARTAGDGDAIDVVYPATGEVWLQLRAATLQQLDDAVAQARSSFDEGVWCGQSLEERARVIERAGELLAARSEELAGLIVADNGKTLLEAQRDIFGAVAAFAGNAAIARSQKDVVLPAERGLEKLVVRDPVGVVAGITPYNAPLIFACLKILPAIAAGNSVVLKPSERSPVLPVFVADVLYEAGLPRGVVSVVHGRADIAAALASDDRVDMISLTGGVPAGTAVMQAAAPRIKNLLLELGGKSAHIVLADADLDKAIAGAAAGIFRNSGQRCFSGSRLLIEASVADEVEQGVAALAQSLVQGDPFEQTTQVGSMIDVAAVEHAEAFMRSALEPGIEILAGGERRSDLDPGAFFRPTVLAGATNDSFAARTELFGPVLTCIRVADVDEAIAVANDSEYGLAGGVWTQDRDKAIAVGRSVRAGSFWANTYGAVAGDCPFGGYGLSGLGREAGQYGFEAYTELKSILFDTTSGTTAPMY